MSIEETLVKFEEEVSLMMNKKLRREQHMVNDLNAKSMDYMMMCTVMEEMGAGHVDYGVLKKCQTWGDILDTFSALLKKEEITK